MSALGWSAKAPMCVNYCFVHAIMPSKAKHRLYKVINSNLAACRAAKKAREHDVAAHTVVAGAAPLCARVYHTFPQYSSPQADVDCGCARSLRTSFRLSNPWSRPSMHTCQDVTRGSLASVHERNVPSPVQTYRHRGIASGADGW
jgi:hypothetical protein